MVAANIPAGTERVYISFSAEINPSTTESLIAIAADLANKRVEEVYLLLSSPGGSVMNGVNLYNVLRAMPFKLITHNVGNVDSIGNAIFLAGEQRYASANATFMFHGVGFNVSQPMRFEEKNLRERLDGVLADQHRISSIIADRSSLSEDEVAGFFREGQTKDAAYAASFGIVHEIRDVQIADGSPVISLVFQRQGV